MTIHRIRSKTAILVAVFGATAGAAALADSARAESFSYVTDGGGIMAVDLGRAGKSQGDLYVFSGNVLDAATGAQVGRVLGEQISVALGRRAETVQGSLTFELPDGSIVAGGLSRYPLDANDLVVGARFVRPILGGTGRYAGTRGTLTTVRRPQGGYEQRFDLSDPATTGQRTLEVYSPGGVTQVDVDTPGISPGDLSVLAAPLSDAGDTPIGRLRGAQAQITTADGLHVAIGQITYELADGSIVVGGTSRRPLEVGGLVPQAAFERAVLGGTGAYAGVSGTATTVRDGDRYRTTFALRPGTGSSTVRRVTVRARGVARPVDIGEGGRTPGDLWIYSVPVRGDGRGFIRGALVAVRVEDGAETLAGSVTVELRGRGQIVFGGVTALPLTDAARFRRSFDRAVLGGTGDFAGAHGTVRTVRRGHGYRMTFSLGAP